MPDTIEERLARLRAQQGQSVEERLAALRAQQQQPPANESYYQWLKRNVGIEGQAFLRKVGDAATSGYEILREGVHGNFVPLRETAELAYRNTLPLIATAAAPGALAVPQGVAAGQAGPIAQVEAQRTARRASGPDAPYWQRSREDIARLEAARAADPALSSKILRGVAGAAPYVGIGILSGGSVPMSAALSGALELNTPENLVTATALGAIPAGGARGASAVAERVLGRGAQAVEQEVARGAQMALPGFENAVKQAVEEIPQPLAKRIAAEAAALYHVPRSLMASADLSALRQGALIAIQPTNWGKAGRATVKMFQALRPKNYDRIVGEIAADADSKLGQQFGLQLTSQARDGLRRAEEGFITKYSGRIPIVAGSERAFTAFLDSLRLDKFKQLRKIIDAQDFTAAQRENAYKLASDWVNIASGRGSLGAKFESAMPILNATMFAPRYAASRIQVINPATYLKNAGTAEGRVILKHQMSELAQYAGVIASTLAIAKAAGAEVALNPSSSDFLKVRIGRYRYDPLSGIQQVMRLVYRTGAAITNAARGEKVKPGEGALDIGGHFLRSKLGPVPSYFTDFALGRTYTGKPFGAARGAAERVLPIMWGDWLDAYQNEGWRGVGMVTPGLVGIGVSAFDEKPASQRGR